MTTVGVMGAKGGCGASLVACNLGVALSQRGGCILVDLNPVRGCDDLLLGLEPSRTWVDLLPVAAELTQSHLRKALFPGPASLQLLAAPPTPVGAESSSQTAELIRSLKPFSRWLILDLPSGDLGSFLTIARRCDLFLLVSTADAPALRACRRLLEASRAERPSWTALAINQIGRGHPAHPKALARSLGLPIAGALPPDMRAVGNQLAFGHPAALDRGSPFGRSARALAERLAQVRPKEVGAQARTEAVRTGDGGSEGPKEAGG